MMNGNTKKSLSWGEQFQNLTYLLKNTFTVVSRDPDILKPLYRNIIYSLIQLVLFFAGIFCFGINSYLYGSLLILAWIVSLLYFVFYLNYQEMRMSWLVGETIQGNDRSYGDACERTRKLKSEVRLIALTDIFMAYLSSRSDDGGGFISGIINLFIEGLEEVWDLANHYLIPCVAMDGKTLKQGITSMKQLKDKVPESLVGIFGIDLVGSIVRLLVFPLHLVFFVVAILLASFGAGMMPEGTIIFLPENLAEPLSFLLGPEGRLSWLPILVLLFLSCSISSVLKRTVTAVKIMYFTVFYAVITHADKIAPDLRDELENYLKLDEQPSGESPTEST